MVTEAKLRRIFSKFGDVLDITVKKFEVDNVRVPVEMAMHFTLHHKL
jgi:hypothetical protein